MEPILIAFGLALGAPAVHAKPANLPAVPGRSRVPHERELAAPVRALFAAKCARCHDAHRTRPKGTFGYVTDLKRLAANPVLVMPFRPDQSRLWVMLRDNEMPPPGSKAEPLTLKEKETVRAWIAGGALPPSPGQPSLAPALGTPADEGEAAAIPDPALLTHLLTPHTSPKRKRGKQ